jgi:GNAT superfamily N-acetyltransferase
MNSSQQSRSDSSNPEMRIRQATIKDVDAVVKFNTALARETEGKQLEPVRLRNGVMAVLDNPEHGFYLLAEEPASGNVIGQLLITYEWSDWRNGVFWWLQSVYVHQAWRRCGVFRRLYFHVLEEAKIQKTVAGVRLYVEKENHLAQQAYQELGLLPAGYHVYELDLVLPKSS